MSNYNHTSKFKVQNLIESSGFLNFSAIYVPLSSLLYCITDIIKTKLLSSMTVMAVRSFCSNITSMQSRKTLQI